MVYVDQLQPCLPNKNWRYCESCHLAADSLNQLHDFAARLGLQRSWFQNHPRLPHYDLTKGMRFKALKMGAIEIDHKKLVELMNKKRLAETATFKPFLVPKTSMIDSRVTVV